MIPSILLKKWPIVTALREFSEETISEMVKKGQREKGEWVESISHFPF